MLFRSPCTGCCGSVLARAIESASTSVRQGVFEAFRRELEAEVARGQKGREELRQGLDAASDAEALRAEFEKVESAKDREIEALYSELAALQNPSSSQFLVLQALCRVRTLLHRILRDAQQKDVLS